MSKNCNAIVIYLIYGQFGVIRKPDVTISSIANSAPSITYQISNFQHNSKLQYKKKWNPMENPTRTFRETSPLLQVIQILRFKRKTVRVGALTKKGEHFLYYSFFSEGFLPFVFYLNVQTMSTFSECTYFSYQNNYFKYLFACFQNR